MEAQSLHYSWSWAMACWIAKAINMNFLFGEIEIIPPSGSRSFSSGMRLDETESRGHLNCELESWRLGLWMPSPEMAGHVARKALDRLAVRPVYRVTSLFLCYLPCKQIE